LKAIRIILPFIFLVLQSFQGDFDYQLLVHPTGVDMEAYVTKIYNKIDFKGNAPSEVCFKNGIKGYHLLKLTDRLNNPRYLTLIDMSLSSNIKRMWVIDMDSNALVFNELTSHGKNSGDEYATSFSNTNNSHQSSLGFYVTGDIYYGRQNLSVKLHGLENGFNSNAFARGIVIHGADYVSESFAEKENRLGRSYGCPAVRQTIIDSLSKFIANGSCLYMHYPDKHYQQKSTFLNSEQYIPIEWLDMD
jgi:hypothetical protein